MRGGAIRSALCGATLLAACAPRTLPPPHHALEPGAWEVASLRSRLGEKLVELSPEGTAVVDAAGQEHRYAARGSLLLAGDGTCRLLLDLRVDGGAPGHSERPCTWRSEGDLLALADLDGAATVYRVERQGGGAVLEAVADVAPDGQRTATSGERLVLQPVGRSAPLAQLPEGEGDEG